MPIQVILVTLAVCAPRPLGICTKTQLLDTCVTFPASLASWVGGFAMTRGKTVRIYEYSAAVGDAVWPLHESALTVILTFCDLVSFLNAATLQAMWRSAARVASGDMELSVDIMHGKSYIMSKWCSRIPLSQVTSIPPRFPVALHVFDRHEDRDYKIDIAKCMNVRSFSWFFVSF